MKMQFDIFSGILLSSGSDGRTDTRIHVQAAIQQGEWTLLSLFDLH